jgi:pilus assembly protein Flp/PilA
MADNQMEGNDAPRRPMFKHFLAADDGQGLVEYALIISLVAMVVLGAMQALGSKSNNSINNAATSLS